jgi:hypothetical protein
LIVVKAIDFINKKAVENGVIPANEKLIGLAQEIKSLTDPDCDVHLIDLSYNTDDEQTAGVTAQKIDDIHPDKLGQIRDADIVIFPFSDFLHSANERHFEDNLFRTLVHELLHAVGIGHNFALGTAMDNSGLEETNTDMSLEYEMSVLSFLYGEPKENIDWPLVRTKKQKHTYEPDEKYLWAPVKQYKAKVENKSFVCEDDSMSNKKINYSHLIPNEFMVKITNRKTIGENSNYDFMINIQGWVDKIFKGKPSFYPPVTKRMMPVIKVKEEVSIYGRIFNKKNNSIRITADDQWVYPDSPFIDAYSKNDKKSRINWHISAWSDNNDNLSCDMKIKFDLE